MVTGSTKENLMAETPGTSLAKPSPNWSASLKDQYAQLLILSQAVKQGVRSPYSWPWRKEFKIQGGWQPLAQVGMNRI